MRCKNSLAKDNELFTDYKIENFDNNINKGEDLNKSKQFYNIYIIDFVGIIVCQVQIAEFCLR